MCKTEKRIYLKFHYLEENCLGFGGGLLFYWIVSTILLYVCQLLILNMDRDNISNKNVLDIPLYNGFIITWVFHQITMYSNPPSG